MAKKNDPAGRDLTMVLGASVDSSSGTVTARKAGGLWDMRLKISPNGQPLSHVLQNVAKAINIALQEDFLQTELDCVYKSARVRKGTVVIQHRDFVGLGDGFIAQLGRTARSFSLTLQGPDPSSPEGRAIYEEKKKGNAIGGMLNLIGRKLDLVREYEDQVPVFVEQMFDRLEAASIVVGWNRLEWQITTEVIGLDVILKPILDEAEDETESNVESGSEAGATAVLKVTTVESANPKPKKR